MSKLKRNFYRLTGLNKTKTYVETGTYYGINLEEVLDEYENIYSIEIEKKWIDHNLATGELKFEWIVASDEERAKMEAAIENGMDAIYAEYAERGIPNAREIYESLNK